MDEGTDTGAIILQKAVEGAKQGDTPEILQRRVMEEGRMENSATGNRPDRKWNRICKR